MHTCDVGRLACISNEPFIWNFSHVKSLGQELTLSLRSQTNAIRRAIRSLRNFDSVSRILRDADTANWNSVTSALWPQFLRQSQGHGHHFDIFKRNANAFSHNAIVDVRLRRRHEMIFCGIFRKLFQLATSKIYHRVVLDSLYISTGNDVTNYFRSEANRTNV